MVMTQDDLMKIPEYRDAFHTYYQYIKRNKRYAMIYQKKMEKIKKMMSQQPNTLDF